MDQVRPQLPFCSNFYGCKSLQMLYLFISQQSVNLRQMVMLTDKIGHFRDICLSLMLDTRCLRGV